MNEKYYGKIVGKNLKRIAYEHHKTQADIARDLKISKATVSSWMNGTRVPRMDKIDLLCHYFNCKRVDIMEEQNSEQYYLNDKTKEIANELLENPGLRELMDASRHLAPEQLKIATQMVSEFKRTNPDG